MDTTETLMRARQTRYPPAFDPQITTLQTRVDAVATDVLALKSRVATLEAEPPPLPMPSPPARVPLTAYLPLVLSILLILSDQTAVVLHTLRPSAPVTVALVIATILSASIPEIRSVLGQQQAHALGMERERTANTLRMMTAERTKLL